MSCSLTSLRGKYPLEICRQGAILFLLVLLAICHASWAVGQLARNYDAEGQYAGGFRLLGDPVQSLQSFLVHLDFGVLLIAIVWLVRVRQIWPASTPFSPESTVRRHRLALILTLLGGGILLFWNLGGPTLWQDEAQSALISRTVLQTGLPRGTDGLNFFSQEQGAEYANGYLWRWHTWLPFYMVAGAFQTFGESAWSARLPGAVLGWLTILLVYRVAWEMWRDRRTALAAAGILSIHVGMILLSRQCRYYSALSFFTVVSLWGYWRILHGGAYGRVLLITGMTALFHTHYVYTVICGAAFLSHTVCCSRGRLRPVLISAAWVVGLCLPWVIWFSQMKYASRYGSRTFDPQKSLDEFFILVHHFNTDIVPWTLWVVPLLVYQLPQRAVAVQSETPTQDLSGPNSPTVVLSWLIAAHFVLLAPIIPLPFYRYLTPVIPLAMLLVGRSLALAYGRHPALAGWAVVVFGLSSPLTDFIHEQSTPVLSPVQTAIDYLEKHADSSDVIAANYGDLPMKFALPHRIVGGLTGETLTQAPDWIVLRHSICGAPPAFDQEIRAQIANGDFERIALPAPDMPLEHREEPCSRIFRTDWKYPAVEIYRRRLTAQQSALPSSVGKTSLEIGLVEAR